MTLVKIDTIPRGQPDIYLVRRAQAKLAFDTEYKDLMRYYSRPAFERVAETLTEHYWPQSSKSKRAVVNMVQELYTLWLVLAPISFHHLGYWRPGWGSSIFLSWFRTHIHKYKRYYLGRAKYDYADADIEEGFSCARISDEEFKGIVQQYVQQCRGGDTARAVMARMVIAPFLFWQRGRDAVDTAKVNKCGLMWWEDEILFLSSKPWDDAQISWVDLRADPQDVLFWTVSVKDSMLDVQIAKEREKAIKSEIKKALASEAAPGFKLNQINASMIKYYHWARYISTTRRQSLDLEKWVWKRIGKGIVATNPKLKESYYNLKHQKWDTTLRQGRRSMLLDKDVSEDQWRQIWSPRRG